MPTDYKQRLEEIDDEIASLNYVKRALLEEYALSLTDIRVGDRITYGDGSVQYECRRIYMRYGDTLTFDGAKIKKDGTPGSVVGEIWNTKGKPLRKVPGIPRVRRVR